MSINLLALANREASSLHNERGKKTKSYVSGTTMGNKIPGTNIKQGEGLVNLANEGRTFGGVKDTKIRKVKGETSHVNDIEANVIDLMGPLGEAWVASIGSGTINPKTGLREYGLFKSNPFKRGGALSFDSKSGSSAWEKIGQGVSNVLEGDWGTWRPSDGKWGPFGQTSASRARDRAKAEASSRHKAFEDFRRTYEDENIAGIFTSDTEDDSTMLKDYAGKFNDFVKNQSGLNIPSNFVSDNDISDYLDEYDTRKEDELFETAKRTGEKMDLQSEQLDRNLASVNTGNEATGAALSGNLFGQLTQSSDTAAKKNFAGSGDFAAKFTEKQTIETAQRDFEEKDRNREDIKGAQEGLQIDREQAEADFASQTKDLQEDYNQEFWNNMVSWETAINA